MLGRMFKSGGQSSRTNNDPQSVHLYYFPTSYFSQKVLIALREKRVPYSETVVSLLTQEVNEPWFLRINPKGQVPVLQIGDRTVTESDDIIDEVDALTEAHGDAARLVPPSDSPDAALVGEWRRRLGGVDVELLTYGVMLNWEMHTDALRLPGWMLASREGFTKMQKESISRLEGLKEWNPDLTKALDMKIHIAQERGGSMYSVKDTRKALNKLEELMDAVEAQLRTCRHVHSTGHWLCGPEFTAADISLCVLLARLDLLGYLSIMDPAKRPALAEYWATAQERRSVTATVDVIRQLKIYFFKKLLWRVAKGAAVTAAVAVAAGVIVRGARG